MKRKNVKVGQFIVAKNTHGGGAGNLLTKGETYKVRTIERTDYSGSLYCQVHLENNPNKDTLWVDPKYFHKPNVLVVTVAEEPKAVATVRARLTDPRASTYVEEPAPKFEVDDIVELTSKWIAYHDEVIPTGLYRVIMVDNHHGVTIRTEHGGCGQASLPENALIKVGEYARI